MRVEATARGVTRVHDQCARKWYRRERERQKAREREEAEWKRWARNLGWRSIVCERRDNFTHTHIHTPTHTYTHPPTHTRIPIFSVNSNFPSFLYEFLDQHDKLIRFAEWRSPSLPESLALKYSSLFFKYNQFHSSLKCYIHNQAFSFIALKSIKARWKIRLISRSDRSNY